MKIHQILLLFASLWVLNSCNKVELPTEGTPVFSLSGRLDNQSFDWQAGVNERYMLADFDALPVGKLIYTADLGQLNSQTSNSPEQFVIKFVQSEPAFSPTNVNSTIRTGEFEFATATDSGNSIINVLEYTTDKRGIDPFLLSIKTDSASFNDLYYEGTLLGLGNDYIGSLTISMIDSFDRVSTQRLYVNLPEKIISGVYLKVDGYTLTAHVFGATASGFDWIGVQSVDSTATIDSVFQQTAGVVAILTNGQIVTNNMDFGIDFNNPCNIRLNLNQTTIIDSTGIPVPNYENGRVIVQYIDKSGQVFSSDFAKQSSDSFFNINSVEEYEINENRIPTKKLDVDFNCTLMNETRTVVKKLSNVKGVIAIGYPE